MPAVVANILKRLFVGPWGTTLVGGVGSGSPYVNASNAIRYTPVYRAVTLIANDIARVPLEVTASGADSLMRSPSTLMSSFEFRRTMTLQMLLWGNAFAAIQRTRGGEFLELVLLSPDSVSLDTTTSVPFYRTQDYGDLPLESVFHLRAPSASGLWGDSPIALCRTSLQILAAQENMAKTSYENAGNPKIAIIHQQKLDPALMQKVEDYYMQRHGGSANAGKPVVLGDGVRVERISSTLDDTGLESARRYSIGDVSRIYGVPELYLGVASSGNAYGSLEWTGRQYVDGCLRAWLEVWSSEIRTKLATPFDSVSFDVDALQRPGMAETMAALRTGVEAGFLTRNEARARLDLEPLPGLDEPTLALNMGAGGGSTNIGTDTSAQEGTPNDF